MTIRLARVIGMSLIAIGTLWLPGCTGSSTPGCSTSGARTAIRPARTGAAGTRGTMHRRVT